MIVSIESVRHSFLTPYSKNKNAVMKHLFFPVLLLILGVASLSGCRTCQPCCETCGGAYGAMTTQTAQTAHISTASCPSGTCPLVAQEAVDSQSPNLISFDGWLPPVPIADRP